jgi:hypothetical protein
VVLVEARRILQAIGAYVEEPCAPKLPWEAGVLCVPDEP